MGKGLQDVVAILFAQNLPKVQPITVKLMVAVHDAKLLGVRKPLEVVLIAVPCMVVVKDVLMKDARKQQLAIIIAGAIAD
mmetsp:Transcript_2240/g.2865  ORF Transcript_2240/g.2865 Transcript_2240/m.2865 type:complete len:80 (-) Transcript_2240:960-1199(-)